jgi:hypothetical protein
MTATSVDEQLVAAFNEFIDGVLTLLENAKIPSPPSTPAQIATGALLGKILRLADATMALAGGHHPNDTGPTLRAILNLYVNLKFICTYESPDAASIRFMRRLFDARAQLRRSVLRPDIPTEGFPVMTRRQWEKDEADLRDQWKQVEKWARDNDVTEMKSLAKTQPWWKFWKKKRPSNSWSGLSDAALFTRVGEKDAYRFYSFFSNEIHGNIAGIGDVVTALNAGRIEIADAGPIAGPLALASKYVILSVGYYRDYLSLPIDDPSLQRLADTFAAALASYPRR